MDDLLGRAARPHRLHDVRAYVAHAPLRGSVCLRIRDGPHCARSRHWLWLRGSFQRPYGTDGLGCTAVSVDSRSRLPAVRGLHGGRRVDDPCFRLRIERSDGLHDLGDRRALLQSQSGAVVGVAMGALSGDNAVRRQMGVGDDADGGSLFLDSGARAAHAENRRGGR